jgi:hypothetical protein
MLTTRRPLARLASLGLLGLCCGALGVLALCALTGRLSAMSLQAAASLSGVLLGGALATGYAGLFLKASGKIRVAFEIAGLLAALLGAEVLLRVLAPQPATTQQARKIDANRLGLPFDVRTKSEVVDALRAAGVEAFPGMSREWPRHPSVRQQLPEGLFPLSDASDAEIVECNESGQYLRFHTDEFGFNNPPGLLLSGNVQVAAVGESFTLGHCVSGKDSFIAQLRATYPRLANLGMEGSSALAMLATFREYVEPLKPPIVLWIIHCWSVDAAAEYADPILRRYLEEPGFSQHLMQRRAEVDEAMRAIALPVQYESDAAQQRMTEKAQRERFAGILTLSQLRERLHLPELLAKPSAPIDFTPFDRSIDLARRTTEAWGGHFVVVLMPLYEEVVTPSVADPVRHDKLAGRMRAHGVDVIDTVPTFLRAADPAELYLMGRANHPSAAGHRLLADYIKAQLGASPAVNSMLAKEGAHK